jgi:hypothetical protein
LDPCRGEGAFFDLFPPFVKREWCEVTENKDFFDYIKHVDCIVGNPPFSIWNKWLKHTMTLTDKFCYLFSFMNFTPTRLNEIHEKGFKLTQFHLVKVDYWFSQSILALFIRDTNVKSIISVEEKTIPCHVCGTRCGRGRGTQSSNVCAKF